MKRSRRYLEAAAKIEQDRLYAPWDAIRLFKEFSGARFSETMEAHLRLGVDPRHADQQVRGTVLLPNGTGKEVRVLVFAQGDKAREAEQAGADYVGLNDFAEKIQGGWLDFDAAVSTPDVMSTVGKLGRVLGPRGLMPNPKAGTVTFDVGKAVKDLKAGKVEYRVDKFGIVHSIIGKVSFDERQLLENYFVLLEEVIRAKPSAAKGRYLKSIALTTSMGPSMMIDTTKTRLPELEAV